MVLIRRAHIVGHHHPTGFVVLSAGWPDPGPDGHWPVRFGAFDRLRVHVLEGPSEGVADRRQDGRRRTGRFLSRAPRR